MQQTPNHKQGSGSSAFQFAKAPYGSYSIVARNSNKADPAFQLQSQQTLDNQHLYSIPSYKSVKINADYLHH